MASSTREGMLPAAHHHAARAGDFENVVVAFAETWISPSIFDATPVISSISDSGARSTTRARKTSASWKMGARVCRRGRHLDQRQLARHAGELSHVVHVENIFNLEQRGLDAMAGAGGASATIVMRETSGRSEWPTVSEMMLMFRRRNSEATRVSTPGLSSTSATNVCSISHLSQVNKFSGLCHLLATVPVLWLFRGFDQRVMPVRRAGGSSHPAPSRERSSDTPRPLSPP